MELEVDASELKSEGKKMIQDLADFLAEKTGVEVVNESRRLKLESEEGGVSKKYLRVLVKKFLHKRELREVFRVISVEEDVLKIKERREYAEE